LLFAVFDVETIKQLTVDGFFRGCSYGLLGAGFALILGVTGRFHFAYGFTYTLAVYMAYQFTFPMGLPFWPSAILGIAVATIVGMLIERIVYRPLAANAGANALLAIFVASLGLGIAGENLIRLYWGSETQAYYGPTKVAYTVWGTTFLNFDVWQAASAVIIILALAAVLRWTALGRQIKATRVNPELARIIGINANTVYLIVFGIGTAMAGVAAIWYGLKYTVDPGMGFTPVIYAFVVAFLAGTASSPIRVFITGIIVALIEQYSSIWLSARWTQTAVFVVLVVYLCFLAFKTSAFSTRLRRLLPAGRA
jgi:branched-subunit amino acid ABC-type transport system permease component